MFQHAFRWKLKCDFQLTTFLIVTVLCCLNVSLSEFVCKNKFNLYSTKHVNSNVSDAQSDCIDVRRKSRKSHAGTNDVSKSFANGRHVNIELKKQHGHCQSGVEQVNDFYFIDQCKVSVNGLKRHENFSKIRVKRELSGSPEKKESVKQESTLSTSIYHDAITLLIGKLWFDRPIEIRKKKNNTAFNKYFSFMFNSTTRHNLTTSIYHDAIKMKLGHLWFGNTSKKRKIRIPTENLEHILTTRPEERPWSYNEKELYIRYSLKKVNRSLGLSPHMTAFSYTFPNTPRTTFYDKATIIKLGDWFQGYLSKYSRTTYKPPKRNYSYDPTRLYNRSTSSLLWKKVRLGHLWFSSNETDDESNDPNFYSKYYDPKGFHGQETHPIYGRYGSRYISKWPRTPEPDINGVRVVIFTRGPNETLGFTVTYDSEEIRKLHGSKTNEPYTEPTDISDDSKFWEKYHDPKGYHGQETHPIYGRFGSRFISKWPLTPEPEESGVWVAEFTRGPNETLRFTITTRNESSTNPMKRSKSQGLNSKIRRRKTKTTEAPFQFTDPIDISDESNFWEKYYDPKGYHGQETHPIYGRFGSRFISKWPLTPEPDQSHVRVKIFTRGPNETLRFTVTYDVDDFTTTPPITESTPEYSEEIDSDDSKFYEKHYDPKGFHGQETHPIYGRYGSRFISKWPLTTEPWHFVRVKVFTRGPNETLGFTVTTSLENTTEDVSYYSDESEPVENQTRVRRSLLMDDKLEIPETIVYQELKNEQCDELLLSYGYRASERCVEKSRCKRFALGVNNELNKTVQFTIQSAQEQTSPSSSSTVHFTAQSAQKQTSPSGSSTVHFTTQSAQKQTSPSSSSTVHFTAQSAQEQTSPSSPTVHFTIQSPQKQTSPGSSQIVSFTTQSPQNQTLSNSTSTILTSVFKNGSRPFRKFNKTGIWTKKTVTFRTRAKTTIIRKSLMTFNYSYFSTFSTKADWRFLGLPSWIWHFDKNTTVPDYILEQNVSFDTRENIAFSNVSDKDYVWLDKYGTHDFDEYRIDMENLPPGRWEARTGEPIEYPHYITYTTPEGYSHTTRDPNVTYNEEEMVRAFWEKKKNETTYEGFIPVEEWQKWWSERELNWRTNVRIYYSTKPKKSKQTTTEPTTFCSTDNYTTAAFAATSKSSIENHSRKKRSVMYDHASTIPTNSNATTTNDTALKAFYTKMMSKFSLEPRHFSYKLPKFKVPTEGETIGYFYTGEHVDWKWVKKHFGTVANRTYGTPDSVERAWLQIKWSDENDTTLHPYFQRGFTDYPLRDPEELEKESISREKRSAIGYASRSELDTSSTSSSINTSATTLDGAALKALYTKMMTKFSLEPRHFSYKLPKFKVPTEGKTIGYFYTGEHVDWKWVKKHFGTVANRTYGTPDSVERAWLQIKWSDENDTTLHPYFQRGFTDYPIRDPEDLEKESMSRNSV